MTISEEGRSGGTSAGQHDHSEIATGTSAYWAYVQHQSRIRGVEPSEVVASERQLARDMVFPTNECLLPDIAEELVAERAVSVLNGSVIVSNAVEMSNADQLTLRHVNDCDFCQSMILAMAPRADAKRRFLDQVALEASLAKKARHWSEVKWISSVIPLGIGLCIIGLAIADPTMRRMAYAIASVVLILDAVGCWILFSRIHKRRESIPSSDRGSPVKRAVLSYPGAASLATIGFALIATYFAGQTITNTVLLKMSQVADMCLAQAVGGGVLGCTDQASSAMTAVPGDGRAAGKKASPGERTGSNEILKGLLGSIDATSSESSTELTWEVLGKSAIGMKVITNNSSGRPKAEIVVPEVLQPNYERLRLRHQIGSSPAL